MLGKAIRRIVWNMRIYNMLLKIYNIGPIKKRKFRILERGLRAKKMHGCGSSNMLCCLCNIYEEIAYAFSIYRQIDHSKKC